MSRPTGIPTPADRPRTGRRGAALVLALAVGLLTACGGNGDADPAATATAETSPTAATTGTPAETGTSAEPVTVTAVDFAFELPEDTFPAGEHTFRLVNEGEATHNLVIERDGEDIAAAEAIPPGESSSVTVELEPGEYVFYCSIGNHREMGMETTVTVTD